MVRAGEPGNDSEAEAHSAMGGGDDADDVTTELLEPAGRTADAASAMMDAVAKASADEAEGPAAVALPAAALSAAVAAATAAGTVGDSEEPDAGPLSQPLVSPPQAWRLQWASKCCSSQGVFLRMACMDISFPSSWTGSTSLSCNLITLLMLQMASSIIRRCHQAPRAYI